MAQPVTCWPFEWVITKHNPVLTRRSLIPPSLHVALLALCGVLALCAPAAASPAERNLYQQRSIYKAALDQLTAGRTAAFEQAKAQLADYALYPYLEYHELQSRLSTATTAEIVGFREAHADLPAAQLLYQRWLMRLGQRHEWNEFLAHYEETTDPELRCYYLRALHATGQSAAAFADVAELWTVAKSQPKACDPLFEAWISGANLTESIVWKRLKLALVANQRQLARYLLRFFESGYKPWAQTLYNVHVNPRLIANTSSYSADNQLARDVIAHGLHRLAAKEPMLADKAWQSYRRSHDYPTDELVALDDMLLIAKAKVGVFPDKRPEQISPTLAQGMSEAAVAQRNWTEAYFWIEQLPQDVLRSNRWQYWFARALATSHLGSERARLAYRALAEERDYYGFLAAERIGSEAQLNHTVHNLNPVQVNQLRRIAGVNRAVELYAVGDLINARREWNKLIPEMQPTDQANAAYLALQMGWTSQGIQIANAANLRDHLDLRFPVVYQEVFQQVSAITTVPHSFLLAIARQESAFDPRARSSANARGLMQLMQSTAGMVARRTGLPAPSISDLYNPAINAEISGHHIAELMTRYGNRRPLVAAAYNAGEHRVDQWIKGASGIPIDVWIETIPFTETRNYVKNVLAFAQVYGQLLGSPIPMLQVHEAAVP